MRGMSAVEGHKLVEFYYLNASDISEEWPLEGVAYKDWNQNIHLLPIKGSKTQLICAPQQQTSLS
jgi:hypothetical protein